MRFTDKYIRPVANDILTKKITRAQGIAKLHDMGICDADKLLKEVSV